MLHPISGHKGCTGYKVHMKGYEMHSSLLRYSVSAIMMADGLIQRVNDRNAAQQLPSPTVLAQRFDPPFNTFHIGMINGGTAHNITAADCELVMEMQVVPGEDLETHAADFENAALTLHRSIAAVRPEVGVHLHHFFRVTPLMPETNGAAEALVRKLTGSNAASAVSYGTEAGFDQAHGDFAIVCGPGDIAQAHQPDEYLEESQFQAGRTFLARLVKELQ